MTEFAFTDSYYLFAQAVTRKSRYIQDDEVRTFLAAVMETSAARKDSIEKSSILFRAQRGYSWRTENLDLPHVPRPKQPFLTATQMGRIIRIATEPQATFYWMAAEAGLRAGELAGLRKLDVDLANRRLSVEQSIWNGAEQTPKTESSVRTLSISRPLAKRLSTHLTKRGQ